MGKAKAKVIHKVGEWTIGKVGPIRISMFACECGKGCLEFWYKDNCVLVSDVIFADDDTYPIFD